MATYTAFEAKSRFGELLDRVERGEEVIITRHDKPIARVQTVRDGADLAKLKILVGRIRAIGRKSPLNPPGKTKLSIAELINEGRPL